MTLVHYIIVRRDLPLGLVLANVAHAAGESFYQLAQQATFELLDLEGFEPSETIAIVKGARNEGRLKKLHEALAAADVPHSFITETDGEYTGQAMAIGVVPVSKGTAVTYRELLNDFQLLQELGTPGAQVEHGGEA